MEDRAQNMRNDAAPWSDFDADGYAKVNYATVLPEDEEIIRFATSFLIRTCGDHPPKHRAVNVGAGPNLYPSMLMLPWTRHIDFTEYAQSNIDWLTENVTDEPGEWAWQPFWDLMAGDPRYNEVARPRRQLAAGHDIMKLSVFDLPANTWELGHHALRRRRHQFGRSGVRGRGTLLPRGELRPGSPFLMAFMEGSTGYDVSGVQFPAVKITQDSLAELVDALPVTDASVLRTDNSVRPVRPGYDAMLLVTGQLADHR